MKSFSRKQSGISLVEVVIALGIIFSMLIAVGYSVTTYVNAREELLDNTKSLYLAEEGYEILRVLRDEDWNNISALTVGDTYYFEVSTTTLAIGGAVEVIDGEFYRSFILEDVYRDSNDDVTASTTPGATVDPETLSATFSVFGPTGTTSLTALLANYN